MGWTRFFRRRAAEQERAEEMQAHLDLYVDELIAEGRSPEEARREARLRFGNPRARLEELDQLNRAPVVDTAVSDVRFALRVLRRTPAFSFTAVVTLALVIGACTAVYSLAHALLLEPLPYPHPERLALVSSRVLTPTETMVQTWQDGAAWEAVRDGVQAADVAVYVAGAAGTNLVVGDSGAFVDQQRVGAGFFRVLGVSPLMGREFTEDEDRPGGPAVTVLGFGLWQRVFGADAGIIGRRILLRGEPHTVVGVMPEDFVGIPNADVWTPLQPNTTGEGAGTNYRILARIDAGATVEQVEAEMAPLVAEAFRLRGQLTDDGVTVELGLEPLQAIQTESVRQPIILLGTAVGAVLLIACVNLAALLLARGGSRGREIATRMAVGAGRAVVVRQLMVEAVVLALAGGALGVVVGGLTLRGLQAVGGQTYGAWAGVTMDGNVLLMTAGLSLVTSLIFGLVPAWQASRLDVQAALASGGSRSVAGAARRWPRRALVVTEVALGVALLVSAGLLMRTFVNLQNLDPGFDPNDLVTTSVSLQDARYTDAQAVTELFDRTVADLEATPGIESAAVSLEVPYKRLLNLGFRFVGEESGRISNVAYVTPRFLETWRLPLLAGRAFGSADTADGAPVVLVNEGFVRIYSPDQNPVGRLISMSGTERQIVGVTKDVQQRAGFSVDGMTPGPLVAAPLVFLPAAQMGSGTLNVVHTWFRPVWSVRSSSPGIADAAVRAAIAKVDPLLPVAAVTSMRDVMAAPVAEYRLLMTLVGVLATAAVLLSAIGIHGLIAHAVGQRRREFGIRMALGATPGRTMRAVAAGGVLLAAIGAAIGGGLSLLAVRLVQSFLWGVDQYDPPTYLAVAAAFLLVATVASVVPAARILRLDPVRALREG